MVSWTIVRMLLEPPVIFGLDMKQGDYTVPFFMYLLQKMYMLECLEVFKKKGKFSNWKGRFRNYIDPQGTSLNSSR